MVKKIKYFFVSYINKLRNIGKRLQNPKMFLADVIYSFYKCDKDKIPLPLFNYILSQYGPWAGFSIYWPIREYQYRKKIRKIKKFFIEIILPIIVFSLLIYGAKQDKDNFFFGFVQNVLSDVFLLILVIYLIPKTLNKPKKYNLSINYIADYSKNHKESTNLILSLKNTGEEIYKAQEIFWEIFIPKDLLQKEDITILTGKCPKSDELFRPMWKFSGENSSPLFIGQEVNIAKLKISINNLKGSSYGPTKIYYKLLTISGNIPEFENISLDFEGMGIPVDKYPTIGELPIMDWYDPENRNITNLG